MITGERYGNEAGTRFDGALAALSEAASAQVLMSQDRCVDALLDLYTAAPTEVVRQLVADVLDDVRHVRAVRCADLVPQLELLAAAAAVEGALFG